MNYSNENIPAIIHQYFPQLAEKKLQDELAEVGQLMQFRAGDIIMDYNSYIRSVPLIIKGSIRVTREDDRDGREVLLYFLNAGDTCSMSFTCCMTDKQSAIRTEALEDTELLAVPMKYVDSWMMKYQSWKNFVMRSYDQRMNELVEVIDSISFTDLDERLFTYLKARQTSTGNDTIKATHKEIALDLNASREAVSRLLKKLEQLGKVELGRNEVKVL
jgi:CRP/FNR family transcriptional regulator